MNRYECLYIISSKLPEEDREGLISKFSDYVAKNGGEVEGIERVGNKRLAYPIAFQSEGYYVLMNFAAPISLPNEMKSLMLITNGIMRVQVIKK